MSNSPCSHYSQLAFSIIIAGHIAYLLEHFIYSSFSMPSEKRNSNYSPLDNEERTHRRSSSTEANDKDDGNLSIPRLRWEQQHSTLRQTWHRWSNSVWFHAIFTMANLLLFAFAIYVNANSLHISQWSAKYNNCSVISPPVRYQVANMWSTSHLPGLDTLRNTIFQCEICLQFRRYPEQK